MESFYLKIENPFESEFINKIAVGGWLLSDPETRCDTYKGDLSVWVSSNSGRLYFRDTVSFKNPEGASWRSIDLVNGHTAASVVCTAYGDLWVATDQGKLLFRRAITKCQPYGHGWSVFELPYEQCIFTQLVADEHTIYGLDLKSCVYLCKNVDKIKMNMTKIVWEKMLKDIKSISLSLSKMVNILLYCIFFAVYIILHRNLF